MTRYLFSSLLLLLLVSCALCGVVSVNGSELFAAENIEAFRPDPALPKENYDIVSVASPLMAGDDDMLLGHVWAEIDTGIYIIFTRYIETGAGWPGNTAVKSNWEPQTAAEPSVASSHVFATVKTKTNFYMFYTYFSDSSESRWDTKILTGAVTGDAGAKRIKWTEGVMDTSKVTYKGNSFVTKPKSRSAFLAGDKPVFVSKDEKVGEEGNVFVISRMDGAEIGGNWLVITKEAEKNCDATFFSLDGKICMAPKVEACTDKALKVWDDSKGGWVVSTGDIAEDLKRLAKEGGFFLNANIDGKGDVLLITEKKPNTQNSQNSDFFLHFVRGKDIEKLPEPIIKDVADISDASIFYSKDQLFFLSKRGAKVDLELLENATTDIKKVLEKWGDSAVLGNSLNIGVVLLCVLFGMWAPIAS